VGERSREGRRQAINEEIRLSSEWATTDEGIAVKVRDALDALGIAYDLRKRPEGGNPGSCYWEFWFDGADVVGAIAVGKLEVKG
jgi:hypothetical protein